MNIISYKMPNISNYMQLSTNIQISSDITLLLNFKMLFRGDNVILDIYKNEISEESKIVSGKNLTSDSIVSHPRPDLDFMYKIECVNEDGVEYAITNKNLHKFYLSFTKYTRDELDFKNVDNELEGV